jgi:membrane protein
MFRRRSSVLSLRSKVSEPLASRIRRTRAWGWRSAVRSARIAGETLVYLFGREGTAYASSIAFSLFLSVFPIIVLVLSAANLLSLRDLREAIFTALTGFFPISQEFIVRNLRIYTRGLGELQIVSAILIAWAGSTFFYAVESGLDSAFRIRTPRRFWRSQVLGTLMAVVAGTLAFLSIALVRLVRERPPSLLLSWIDPLVSYAISFGLAFGLFTCIYIWLPSVRQPLGRVLQTALFASVGWLAVNAVFRLLASSWSLEVIYGPFYVSVTLLLWFYAAGCILLGAARLAADGFWGGAAEIDTEPEPPTRSERAEVSGEPETDPPRQVAPAAGDGDGKDQNEAAETLDIEGVLENGGKPADRHDRR